MLDIPKVMFSQIEKFIKKKSKIGYYNNMEYKLQYDLKNCNLLVKYKEKKYIIKIVNKSGDLYWHLVPYNNSFFETKLDEEKCNLDMVLFAIKEDGDLYGRN